MMPREGMKAIQVKDHIYERFKKCLDIEQSRIDEKISQSDLIQRMLNVYIRKNGYNA